MEHLPRFETRRPRLALRAKSGRIQVSRAPRDRPCRAPELGEVLDLVRRGLVKAHGHRFGLDGAATAYDALRGGALEGRAVIVP
jgi:hypothetical protein